jgi:REP element-mobilizing transposase RayT
MDDRPVPRRKEHRLAEYDYSQGGTYAFTVVVARRRCCLGAVIGESFIPTEAGVIVGQVWERLPKRFPAILLDAFVVMPNHVHGIVFLGANPVAGEEAAINGGATGKPGVVAPPFMAAGTPQPGSRPETADGRVLQPPSRDPIAPALGEIIRSLKAASTTRIRKECLPDFSWQERYWDRIVRNEIELEHYRSYIQTNPVRWTMDREYSDE